MKLSFQMKLLLNGEINSSFTHLVYWKGPVFSYSHPTTGHLSTLSISSLKHVHAGLLVVMKGHGWELGFTLHS